MNDTALIFYVNQSGEHIVMETYFPDQLIKAFGKIGLEADVTPF